MWLRALPSLVFLADLHVHLFGDMLRLTVIKQQEMPVYNSGLSSYYGKPLPDALFPRIY